MNNSWQLTFSFLKGDPNGKIELVRFFFWRVYENNTIPYKVQNSSSFCLICSIDIQLKDYKML